MTTPENAKRVAMACLVGTSIEWYDFFIYGTASALVLPKLFFPSVDPAAGILLSFSTFALAFIVRPIGGLIFGRFGDRLGRKALLVTTVLLMGTATSHSQGNTSAATATLFTPNRVRTARARDLTSRNSGMRAFAHPTNRTGPFALASSAAEGDADGLVVRKSKRAFSLPDRCGRVLAWLHVDGGELPTEDDHGFYRHRHRASKPAEPPTVGNDEPDLAVRGAYHFVDKADGGIVIIEHRQTDEIADNARAAESVAACALPSASAFPRRSYQWAVSWLAPPRATDRSAPLGAPRSPGPRG